MSGRPGLPTVRVVVRFVGLFRTLAGREETQVELPAGTTVAALLEQITAGLGRRAPAAGGERGEQIPPHLVLLNGRPLREAGGLGVEVRDGDTVSLVPPMGGGVPTMGGGGLAHLTGGKASLKLVEQMPRARPRVRPGGGGRRSKAMARDFLNRLGRTLKEGARVVARESEELARVAKLRLDIAGLAGKRDDLWQEIGKVIYGQYEEGREVPAEVMDLCRRAQEVAEKIKAKEAEIAALRAQTEEKGSPEQAVAGEGTGARSGEAAGKCPGCGSAVDPTDRFCRYCGAALR